MASKNKIKTGDNIKLVDITEVVSTALDNAAKGRKAQARRASVKSSKDLLELELQGVKHVKLLKDGTAIVKKGKKGATHKIEGTKLSTLAAPLGKGPKPPKEIKLPAPIGAQVDILRPDDQSWHPPIPEGATWIMYQTSTHSLMTAISDLPMFRDWRGGTIHFGRLRYGEDFVSMMPGEEGNVTSWKTGTTCFAEGKDPSSLKSAAKAAATAAERKAAGLTPTVAAAFKARAEARKVPPGPRPGDVPGKKQNGVSKPGAGGKTHRVWEICDELLAKLKHTPTKAEVFAIAVDKEKASPGMTGTQHSYWRRFYGHQLPPKA